MKARIIILKILFILIAIQLKAQLNEKASFKFNAFIGKSFISYGDIWGLERRLGLEYGKNWYVAYEYGYSSYLGTEYGEDFYNQLSNSSLVTKNLKTFIGGNQAIKFFGYKSLDTKNNIVNLNCHQLKSGYRFDLLKNRLKIGLNSSAGIFILDRIGTDFVVQGVDIVNPNFTKKDVTIFGTFTHSFIDFNYGFGTDFEYTIIPKRLSINLNTNASFSSVRWFTVCLGTKVEI
jgi:hypothetical protein